VGLVGELTAQLTEGAVAQRPVEGSATPSGAGFATAHAVDVEVLDDDHVVLLREAAGQFGECVTTHVGGAVMQSGDSLLGASPALRIGMLAAGAALQSPQPTLHSPESSRV
jgi:hypothetical protein